MRISTAAILTFWLAFFLVHEVARAQEPREIWRTEFGSEFSDGSSTIAGDSASFKLESGALLLKIDSGRPVARAVRTLQARYGYIISYEDPRYTNEDDLQDVSASVVRNYSQYAPGMAPKVIVPKVQLSFATLPPQAVSVAPPTETPAQGRCSGIGYCTTGAGEFSGALST